MPLLDLLNHVNTFLIKEAVTDFVLEMIYMEISARTNRAKEVHFIKWFTAYSSIEKPVDCNCIIIL